MMAEFSLSVLPSVCHVSDDKSRMEWHNKFKIGRQEVRSVAQFRDRRSKVKVTKRINAETENVPYLPKGRTTNFQRGTGMVRE